MYIYFHTRQGLGMLSHTYAYLRVTYVDGECGEQRGGRLHDPSIDPFLTQNGTRCQD